MRLEIITTSNQLTHIHTHYTALLSYDTLCGIALEISVIWRNKLQLGSIFYITVRYSTLLASGFGVYFSVGNLGSSLVGKPLSQCVFLS